MWWRIRSSKFRDLGVVLSPSRRPTVGSNAMTDSGAPEFKIRERDSQRGQRDWAGLRPIEERPKKEEVQS